ncbi:tyrosine-type recombinase/integrase, partial [Polynucleobacter sp. UK-Gri1-W3]|uniref:tyrosine-type recombinase/integrase n=1 Tax=Polynucleobacter sp. UK-Gri1-W3 TaxID=1819737 RepID=UPI001C0D8CA9
SLGLLEDVHDLAIGKAGGFHRISFKSNNLEILLLSQVKGWGDYHIMQQNLNANLNVDRITAGQINRIYKKIARKAGLDESAIEGISGHSMRVGAAQDLLNSGASMPIIMQKGRWSKTDTVMRYLEHSCCTV